MHTMLKVTNILLMILVVPAKVPNTKEMASHFLNKNIQEDETQRKKICLTLCLQPNQERDKYQILKHWIKRPTELLPMMHKFEAWHQLSKDEIPDTYTLEHYQK